MKNTFSSLLLLFFLSAFTFMNAQEANHLLKPDNRLKSYSLQELKDSSVANVAEILINDIQITTPPYVDLYYHVYGKLYYESVDVSKQAILDQIDLQLTIDVQGSASFNDSATLTINPFQDESRMAYRFRKNKTGNQNIHSITQAKLNFNTAQLNAIDSTLLPNLHLELYVEMGRYFTVDLTNINPVFTISDTNDLSNELNENEAVLSWDSISAHPVVYEIEWVHVPHSNPTSINNIDVDFKKYGVRMQTDKTFLPINMLYSSGFLVARSRVKRPLINSDQTALTDQFEYTHWSMPDYKEAYTTNANNVLIIEHQSNSPLFTTNWQYQASYANEGKKKEVITYFDGSSRQRQSNTLLNDFSASTQLRFTQSIQNNSTLISQESYYDYNGEAIISVLPSPILNAKDIAYQKGINTINNNKINRQDFDSIGSYGTPLFDKTNNGAAQYYSDSNQWLGINPFVDHIPDAKGYPYTRVEYLADGSGRLKTQYGMGEDKALDDTKGTRFAYAKPTSSELNRLFGTNIGFADFYKKNISIDPNGVMSMAYIDNQGRTIATSIAGSSNDRSKLLDIPADSVIFNEDLLATGADQFYENRGSYELMYPIFVPERSTYSFEYGFDLKPYFACSNVSVCYDCKYQLLFQIIDEDNTLIVEALDSLVDFEHLNCGVETYALDKISYTDSSVVASVVNDQLLVELTEQKQYTIIKKLSLLTNQLEADAQDYIDNSACDIYDQEHFTNKELNATDFTICETDYSVPSPCDRIEEQLRADFELPDGAFVSGATDNDKVGQYIYNKLISVSGCHKIVGTLTEGEFISELKSKFQMTTEPSFSDYQEDFIDYLILFHPTYCQLTACERYYSKEELKFNELLERSDSLEEFVLKARKRGFMQADDSLILDSNLILTSYKYYLNGADSYSLDTALFPFDPSMQDLIFGGGFFDYYNPYISIGNGAHKNSNLLPKRKGNLGTAQDNMQLFINSYFTDYLGPDYAGNGISYLSIMDSTTSKAEFWNYYKTFYLNAKNAVKADLLSSLVCFGPDDTTASNGDPIGGNSDSLFLCKGDGEYHLPWKSQEEADEYADYDHFTGLGLHPVSDLLENPGLKNASEDALQLITEESVDDKIAADVFSLIYANYCLFRDTITIDTSLLKFEPLSQHIRVEGLAIAYQSTSLPIANFHLNLPIDSIADTLSFLMNSQELLDSVFSTSANTFNLLHDSLVFIKGSSLNIINIKQLTIDSVGFVSNFNADSFVCNPFNYLSNNYSAYTVCTPYHINLSSIISPYKLYAQDTLGNPLFNCSDIKREYHCQDFADAHSAFIAAFDSAAVPQIATADLINPDDATQRKYTNWMNVQLGLSLSIRDYYDFAAECTYDSSTTVFNQSTAWQAAGKTAALKKALVDKDFLYYRTLSNEERFEKIDSALQNTAYSIDSTADFIGFGEVDLAHNQNALYYLENQQSRYAALLDTLNWVYAGIKDSLWQHSDFEDSTQANCKLIDIPQYQSVINNAGLLIDRAYRYANGRVWVRLLKATDSTFYNDYYYYYQPYNGDYYLSEVTSFSAIEPVFDQEEMHYVRLSLDSLTETLLAGTSQKIAQAVRLNQVVLSDHQGMGSFPIEESCEDLKYFNAKINAIIKYEDYINGLKDTFKINYRAYCLNQNQSDSAFTNQYFNMGYTSKEHQFTLYYYDQAGNLVMTVPPDGVNQAYTYNADTLNKIISYRVGFSTEEVLPTHSKQTTYQYDADNQPIKQTTPNGGTSHFWYDKAGRLVLSQNAEQIQSNKFSYSRYDGQSRIYETGEVTIDLLSLEDSSNYWEDIHTLIITGIYDTTAMQLDSLITSQLRNDVVKTYYDETILLAPAGFSQNNLRSRISTVAYYPLLDSNTLDKNWEYASHYSYDATGNVKTLLNDYYQNGRIDNEAYRYKKIDYAYDVISGNVLQVYYQTGEADAFYHRYEYDAENRITSVETSRDGIIWDEDAEYKYYPHGPLARTEIGEHKVQGMDYAYTLEGWLKSINAGHNNADMGGDDAKNNVFAEDAFGMALQYHQNDYQSIGAQNATLISTSLSNDQAQLYNGNISAITWHNQDSAIGKTYTYDQLNRIKGMEEYGIDESNLEWDSTYLLNGNTSLYDYDRNGNITNLQRWDGQEDRLIDDFNYHYKEGSDQLSSVTDTVDAGAFAHDIDNQNSDNYAYDAIGNLKLDSAEGICQILWYPNGKVKQILRDQPSREKANLHFEYDPMGHRVKKTMSFVEDGKSFFRTSYYVRDAQGNIMATYEERDCDYYLASDSLGAYFYQYSETYGYYTAEAVNGSSLDTVLTYLCNNLKQKDELKISAASIIEQIPGINDTVIEMMQLSDYLNLYPAAKERVTAQDAYFYADYAFTNNNAAFRTLLNDKREVWIQYFKENGTSEFYEDLDSLYNAAYGSNTNVAAFFQMNQDVAADHLANTTLMTNLSGLSATELNTIIGYIGNSTASVGNMQAWINSLESELASSNATAPTPTLINKINAALCILDYSSTDVATVFSGINLSHFYNALNWLPTSEKNKLNSILHHFNSLNAAVVSNSPLLGYQPSAVYDWIAADANGDLLKYFMHSDEADPLVYAMSAAYLANLNTNDWDLFALNSSSLLAYAEAALLRNAGDTLICNAITLNDSISKLHLALTENTTQLSHYFNLHHADLVLEQNFYFDSLQQALLTLSHLTPIDYAQELSDSIAGVNFNNLGGCNPHNVYTLAEQFTIFGSKRLGTMDAKVKRKKEDHIYQRKLGAKEYELSDHLGNVMATISDKKMHPSEIYQADTTGGYQANITSRSDYYPFGMPINSRTKSYKVTECLSCGDLKTAMDTYTGLYSDTASLSTHFNASYNINKSYGDYEAALKKCKLLRNYLSIAGGSSNYVDFGNESQYDLDSADFTIEAWIKPAAISGGRFPILSNQDRISGGTFTGINLMLYQSNLYLTCSDGTGSKVIQAAAPSINNWHHIVVQRVGNAAKNADDYKIYINGIDAGAIEVQNNSTTDNVNSAESFKIGSRHGSVDNLSYNGAIKEVRLYRRVLSTAEIANNAECADRISNTANLLLWAPLNEGGGNTFSDNSIYNHSGTAAGSLSHEQLYNNSNACLHTNQLALCNYDSDTSIYSYQSQEHIYSGLGTTCSDYSITDAIYRTVDCQSTTDTNGYSTVTSVKAGISQGNAVSSFWIEKVCALPEMIPNIDPEATYEIKLSLKDTEARTLKAYVPVNNYTLFTSEDSLHHSEKSVTLSFKGAELIAYANNTYNQFTIRMNLGWVANGSSHHGMVEMVNISVTEVLQNVIPANHNYSYGFNGMERDDDAKGSGNSYTTLFRQYDPRLGKWLSRDPKAKQLPWQSPYQSMNNNPILLNDPNGDCPPDTPCDDPDLIDKALETLDNVTVDVVESYDKLTEYLSSLDFTINANARITGGEQVAVGVKMGGAKIGYQRGHETKTLLEGTFSAQYTGDEYSDDGDTGPVSVNRDWYYYGKDDKEKISSFDGLDFFVGGTQQITYEKDVNTGEKTKMKVTNASDILILTYKGVTNVDHTKKKIIGTSDGYYFGLGVQGAIIFGFELSIEFGFDQEKVIDNVGSIGR